MESKSAKDNAPLPRPRWLVKKLPATCATPVPNLLDDLNLNTVCRSARCPNLSECYAKKTATFMILGTNCTRDCGFCAVAHGTPLAVDENEPTNIAEASVRLGLKFVVVTSVTRDDLPDGGAEYFAKTVRALSARGIDAEILTPDFQNNNASIQTVIDTKPKVFAHNVETVRRLSATVRPSADYDRSLDVLKKITQYGNATGTQAKSGIMLGLGESMSEVKETLRDIYATGTRLITLGQYMQPEAGNLPVKEYISPEQFKSLEVFAHEVGYTGVASGSFVRSSYRAAELWKTSSQNGLGVCKD